MIRLFFLSSLVMFLAGQPGNSINDPENSFNVNSKELLRSVNEIRKNGCRCGNKKMPPAPPLVWNDQLAKAAFDHSKEMNAKNYFSHTSKSGKMPGDRIRAAGYRWIAYGENIAFNYEDEASVVDGWLKSPAHCKTMMDKIYKEMGVGRAGPYWTQDFGTR